MHQMREEVTFTDRRIYVRGKIHKRAKQSPARAGEDLELQAGCRHVPTAESFLSYTIPLRAQNHLSAVQIPRSPGEGGSL